MRVLLLFRGAPGCGKSTFIEKHGLKPYTLSADDIRLMHSSPSLNIYGSTEINQNNDKSVWSTLYKILELRMQNGEFTVIDATNSKTIEMKRYKDLCETYRYRIYCIDMTDIPVDVAKKQNAQREELKRVPESAIDKMYARFLTQKIPSGITVLKPDELDRIWYDKPISLSEYKKIHHFGDIHGCYTALKQYFDMTGGLKDDEYYIFTGDYIDRGIENADVVKFLLEIYKKPNVALIEGNHERWLWIWANDGVTKSDIFEHRTRHELDASGISKKDVRQLYRKLLQCMYYTYNGNTYLVTHGGLSTLPRCLTTVATSQMINGVGRYPDSEIVDAAFVSTTANDVYQIHGHRNTKDVDTRVNQRVFNLEGKVEFGGKLRVMRVEGDGIHSVVEIQNTVFRHQKVVPEITTNKNSCSVGDMIIALRENKNIQEKQFGNISSFNFTRDAFESDAWDEQTIKARGLYINIPEQKIVARSYDKFFNINQRPETKLDMLQYKLQFPVDAYVKENGFLGIVSYNAETDELFITTKSNPEGIYSTYLSEIFYQKVSAENIERIKEYSKNNNVSFVFECVDMVNDPHIIEYPENKLFLLDVIYNQIEYIKLPYEELCKIADDFGLCIKKKAITLNSWQEFHDWYYEVTTEDYDYNGEYIEGFVIEDSAGYMVKIKVDYYNFWKFMRSIAHETIRNGYINGKRTSSLTTSTANLFYGWLKEYRAANDVSTIPTDICSLRKLFLHSEYIKKFGENG